MPASLVGHLELQSDARLGLINLLRLIGRGDSWKQLSSPVPVGPELSLLDVLTLCNYKQQMLILWGWLNQVKCVKLWEYVGGRNTDFFFLSERQRWLWILETVTNRFPSSEMGLSIRCPRSELSWAFMVLLQHATGWEMYKQDVPSGCWPHLVACLHSCTYRWFNLIAKDWFT